MLPLSALAVALGSAPTRAAAQRAASAPDSVAPQGPLVVRPRTRLRLRRAGAPADSAVMGRVLRVRRAAVEGPPDVRPSLAGALRAGDTLVIRQDRRWAPDTAVALTGAELLERSRGRPRRVGAAAAVGTLLGALATVAMVEHCEATTNNTEGPPCGMGYIALPYTALIGASVGAVVGLAIPMGRERWERLPAVR